MFAYCIFCRTGYEKALAQKLNKIYPDTCIIAPVRLLEERKGKKWETVERPLLPGYIFFYAQYRVNFSLAQISDHFYKVLEYAQELRELEGTDYTYARWIYDNNGRIGVSTVLTEGDTIAVVSGPLLDNVGKIVKIDRRKRRAIVEFNFNGLTKQISLTVIDLSRMDTANKALVNE